eukprot:10947-Prymnesium_polylepis.1
METLISRCAGPARVRALPVGSFTETFQRGSFTPICRPRSGEEICCIRDWEWKWWLGGGVRPRRKIE